MKIKNLENNISVKVSRPRAEEYTLEARFLKGFRKTATKASWFHDPKKLDLAGLGALAVPTVYHGYKAVKEKDKGGAVAAGGELAGLGLLARSVHKGHK